TQTWAFIQSERAILTIAGIKIQGDVLSSQNNLVLILDIRNGGRSSAFIDDLNVTSAVLNANTPMPASPNYLSGHFSATGPIAPGQTRTSIQAVKDSDAPVILSNQQAESIQNGSVRFYVYGYIKFSDEFTVLGPKNVGFCSVYTPQGNTAS